MSSSVFNPEAAAEQIRTLLLEHNQLPANSISLRPINLIKHITNGEYILVGNADRSLLHGCVRVRKLNQFLAELSHLVVASANRRQGVGLQLIKTAQKAAWDLGCSGTVCTIRMDNPASYSLFKQTGFELVKEFVNPRTTNLVGLFLSMR